MVDFFAAIRACIADIARLAEQIGMEIRWRNLRRSLPGGSFIYRAQQDLISEPFVERLQSTHPASRGRNIPFSAPYIGV